MKWTELEPKVEELQTQLVATMEKIEGLTAQNTKLPSIQPSFTSAKDLVRKSEYNVVVCGEVKKGKSSLLNAIIGQKILPVNSEIATSQVFRVSNSEHESFQLVFSDGTHHAISKEELSRYGSQVDANLQGEPVFRNRTLSHIQVNVPVAFLPKEVSLVDTPGLGALYKSHEFITQNYLRNASAILFVLDPERPIEAQEKKFILKALDVTNEILFVMTKIDLYTPEAWNSIMQRDEVILSDIYTEKGLPMPTIMPVSSLGLLKASTGKVQALRASNLRASRFLEVKDELIKMMFRGVGVIRTGIAMNEVSIQLSKSRSVIEDMLKVCSVDNSKEEREINERMRRQQQQLKEEWGQQSVARQKIQLEIGNICSGIQPKVNSLVSINGPVFKEYEAKIRSAKDLTQLEQLGKSLGQEVVNDISLQWQSIAQQAESQVAIILGGVSTRIGTVGYGNIKGNAQRLDVQEFSLMEKISSWRGAAIFGSVSTALAAAAGTFAVPVIGPIVGVAVGLITWIFGKMNSGNNELEKNKEKFRSSLIELMNNLSIQLLHVQEGKLYSVVTQFAMDLNNSASCSIQSIFERRNNQLETEIRNVERQARADIESRRRDAEMWSKARREWDIVAKEMHRESISFNEIKKALN